MFQLEKNILAPLGITAAALANYGAFQKKIHGSGTTTLIILNEEMNDIMKIVETLEDSKILLDSIAFILEITIKTGAYVINLDEYADVGTHWVAL